MDDDSTTKCKRCGATVWWVITHGGTIVQLNDDAIVVYVKSNDTWNLSSGYTRHVCPAASETRSETGGHDDQQE